MILIMIDLGNPTFYLGARDWHTHRRLKHREDLPFGWLEHSEVVHMVLSRRSGPKGPRHQDISD